uniref:Uncharacterized protein n=1 Tax=Rhizophora mucronata TaxID=61149 RepID=A0A2P2Q6G4_RHIMU
MANRNYTTIRIAVLLFIKSKLLSLAGQFCYAMNEIKKKKGWSKDKEKRLWVPIKQR